MEIELYKTQFDFVNCNDRFTAMLGGVGSGKTLAGSVKSIRYALPKTLGLVVAPTYRMLQDATIRTYRKINEELIASYNKTDSNIVLKNGAEILFRSSDDPDKLRGPNINWAWMDEAGLSKKGTWEIVIGRLRADGQAGPCWVTTTPKGKNWLYDMHKQMTVFKSATTQNPYLSKEFVKSLLDSYTGEFLRQEVYGEFARFEGLVYPDFNEDVHVKKRDPKGFIYWGLAIDEGYTNPAVILLIGVDSDGRKHIHQEFYERGKLQSDVVAMAQEMAAGKNVTEVAVDSSAAGLIADLRNVGLPAVPQKGRILDGIHVVQEHLKIQGDGKPYLTVDPSCVNTINEFQSYVWKPGKDEPVKEMDHAMDAARYYLAGNLPDDDKIIVYDERVSISPF
jgi:PBSX family phage terminase large subunit